MKKRKMKKIIEALRNFKTRKFDINLEKAIIKEVDIQIKNANSNENFANHLWKLKTLLLAQNYYLQFVELISMKKYYDSWLVLEKCENSINILNRHIDKELAKKYYFKFLRFQVSKWQKLYPYNLFASPEFIHKKVKCSICNKYLTPRNNCQHLVGNLYSGEICYHIIEDIELIGVAMVKNPVMKSNVIDPHGENKNFTGIDMILSILPTPFQYWDINYTKTFIPNAHIIHKTPNMFCPCQSGLSYLLCCKGKRGCLIPHYQIIPYTQNIENELEMNLDIKLKISNYLYELRNS
ncbi:hypothetical protein [Bibersteinia trehalosi]|uniref:hypothetical protein n=1 Tax=Bibersteinia trehalosi TaxID=47735 RepID=UPI002D780788|nr:hypothetical protein [Bibersteinia trehalosi]